MEEIKNISKPSPCVQGLGKLHISSRKLVEDFSKRLIGVYGGGLRSIIVYGSALGGHFNPKKSDINMLLILDDINLFELRKCHPLIEKYGRRINPLILTKKYIQSSRDVYPIEFLEMKENYLTVYGEDVLREMKIDRQHLRLECEQQLKGNLLKLRQGFLRLGKRESGLEKLMNESLASNITVFRNLIRIKGEEPPVDKEKVIEKMAEYYNLDKDTFIAILRQKLGLIRINRKELAVYFDKYLRRLEILAEAVDRL